MYIVHNKQNTTHTLLSTFALPQGNPPVYETFVQLLDSGDLVCLEM